MESAERSNFLIQIIVASTRPGRAGLPVGEWVRDYVREKGFEVDFADLAVINLPFLDEPKQASTGEYSHQHTKDWSARVAAADAFIFVMPEYNHGFNAPLKNALDFLYAEWARKPVGLVSYGGVSGGLRSAQMLKPVLTALRMVPLNEAVVIQFVANHFDGERRFQPTDSMKTALDAMLKELVTVSNTLKPLRSANKK